MKLRLMTTNDIPTGMRLKDLAGWNQTTFDWERFLGASPDGCFVAELESCVCGSVTTIIYGALLAWIGMVLVDPEYRGQGIGTRLLERAIKHLDDSGVPTVKLDATPQGKPIYEKFGFRSEYEIERWKLQRPAGLTEPRACKGAVSVEILRLDYRVFGADRSNLLRSLAAEAPDFTVIKARRGEISGYSFGRRGSHADHLGPWVARDEDTARELLCEFLLRSVREFVFVDCVKTNPWAQSLLAGHGFEFSRPLTRMFRGANDNPGRQDLLGAILGPEFG